MSAAYRSFVPFAAVALVVSGLLAQETAPARKPLPATPELLRPLKARPLGPASMSGRVTDLAVHPTRPATFYVGTASGGLWRTTNHGTTFTSLFENENTCSIGDVAISPSHPHILYVGTGEENARNSVTWGDGVYRSTDGGDTWRHCGLADTHHIGAIAIHPKNPNVVYVAALGHFWGPNEERGVFKTVDGGVTWRKVKYLGPDCGFIDLILDPEQPDTLWAAAYRVRRDGFSGGDPATLFGEEAGIYKTTDGGETWKKLTEGLPKAKAGRIGLDQWKKNGKVLVAVYQTEKTNIRAVSGQGPSNGPGDVETGGIFRSDDGGETWKKLNDLCPRPFYFGKIRIDPTNDQRLFVLGIPLFRSDDGGKTFVGNAAPRVHSDHHALWIDPANPEHLLLGCDGGVYASHDRGAAWEHMVAIPVSQFYGVAVDQRQPYWVYGGLQDNGSWGAPSQTRNSIGVANHDWVRIGGGDGFQCAVDPTDWTCVYAESQYGALFRLSMATGERKSIRPRATEGRTYRFNWNSPMLLSPHNPRTLYYGGNHLFRSFDRGDNWQVISGDLTLGKRGSLTTIAESPLQAGILWTGSDDGKLFLSKDGGGSWIDLTDKPPLSPERTVSRVEASRVRPGQAYVSFDRHRNDDVRPFLYRTPDFGTTWQPLHETLPANGSVLVVREDPRNPNLLFCGTEFGLFVSLDAGESWHRLKAGIPTVAVHDLVIHPRDAELVIGTHGRGVWILDISPLRQLVQEVVSAPWHLLEVQPVVNFRRAVPGPGLTGARHFAAANPPVAANVFYHLADTVPGEVKLTIHDSLGNEIAELKGPGTPGLHQVAWNLRRRLGGSRAEEVKREPTRPARARATSTRPSGTAPAASAPAATAPSGSGYEQRPQPSRPTLGSAVPPGEYSVRMTVGGKTQQRLIRVLADGASGSGTETADDE